MPCNDGIDSADFTSGIIDPTTDPTPPTTEITIDDVRMVTDPDGSMWCRFTINITNINYASAVSFSFATANGTATAPGYYVSRSGTYTIPAGQADAGTIDVQVVNNVSGVDKYFFLNLSAPSNGVLDNTQGKGTIPDMSVGPPPPPPDPINDPSYTGFPLQSCNSSDSACTIYDQNFSNCGYENACTAFSTAAAMSALFYRVGGSYHRFNAKKLWDDCPGTPDCCAGHCGGFSLPAMLKYARDTGVQRLSDSVFLHLGSYSALSGSDNAHLVHNLKRAIVDHGCAIFTSKFYSSPNHGWNRCLSCNDGILRNPNHTGYYVNCAAWATPGGDLNFSGVGHAWIMTGWNDNKGGHGGAFEIQSSHGTDWGNGGRCWLPYSYLPLSASYWSYFKVSL